MSPPGLAARQAAATLLAGVLERGRSLADQAGAGGPLAALPPPERARAQALAAATLRHLGRIDAVLGRFLERRPPPAALNALRLATAELCLDGVPAHAAVDGAVRLAGVGKRGRQLSGMVNAVARRVAEGAPALWAAAPEAGLPDWLAGPLEAAWGPEAAVAIAAAHRQAPPLDLTPKRPAEADAWAAALGAERLPTGSLRLPRRAQVSGLPGYAEGAWWVQDAAAALPVRLFGALEGRRALDVCAAPGGKTLQLAAAGAAVTALDASEARLGRLRENLARTGLAAEVVAADALDWTPAQGFDAVLVDAPCSATRHDPPASGPAVPAPEPRARAAAGAAGGAAGAGLGVAGAGGADGLLHLLAAPGRGRGAGRAVPGRDAGGARRRCRRGGAGDRPGLDRCGRRAPAPAGLLAGAGRHGRLLRRLPREARLCRVTAASARG